MQFSGRFMCMMAVGMLLGGMVLAACGGAPAASPLPAGSSPTGDLRSLLAAGQAALDAGNLAVAEQRYREAVAVDPRSAEAQLGLGNALVRQSKLADAAAAYQAALALDPKLVAAHTNLGVVYYQQFDLGRAAQSFEAALRLAPDDPSIMSNLAAVRIQEKNLVEAERLLTRARDLDPALPEIYYLLGALYKFKGQTAEAIAAFEKFLEIGPGQDPTAADHAREELRQLRGQ